MKKIALVALAAVLPLAACGNERTAESETPVSEAEVSTELPESVVSDTTLNATADAAAEMAATPPATVIPVPVDGTTNGAAGADAQAGNESQAQ